MIRLICFISFLLSGLPCESGMLHVPGSESLLHLPDIHALDNVERIVPESVSLQLTASLAHPDESFETDGAFAAYVADGAFGADVADGAFAADMAMGIEGKFRIARVQYRGGGDWYTSPTALTNLIRYATQHIPVSLSLEYDDVALGSRDLHRYPFIFMSGHGNIEVNSSEMENLRNYLENGGFLYVDDDYGFDPYVRPILQNVFPDEDFIELPPGHPIYNIVYHIPNGRPPKIHEHDGQPPQAFGVYRNGRLVLLYTYESNPSDGWAYDQHDNPEEVVDAALRFGVNLLVYVFTSSL